MPSFLLIVLACFALYLAPHPFDFTVSCCLHVSISLSAVSALTYFCYLHHSSSRIPFAAILHSHRCYRSCWLKGTVGLDHKALSPHLHLEKCRNSNDQTTCKYNAGLLVGSARREGCRGRKCAWIRLKVSRRRPYKLSNYTMPRDLHSPSKLRALISLDPQRVSNQHHSQAWWTWGKFVALD